jgi:hypothetical protein
MDYDRVIFSGKKEMLGVISVFIRYHSDRPAAHTL